MPTRYLYYPSLINMQPVTLYFPTITALSIFLLSVRTEGVETNNTRICLTGRFIETQIQKACAEYKATLEPIFR